MGPDWRVTPIVHDMKLEWLVSDRIAAGRGPGIQTIHTVRVAVELLINPANNLRFSGRIADKSETTSGFISTARRSPFGDAPREWLDNVEL
jgi:hypothetical protein